MNQYTVNGEGMTFSEWFCAAYAWARDKKERPSKSDRKDWRNGIDPTEVAAGQNRNQHVQ